MQDRPRLSLDYVASLPAQQRVDVEMPPPAALAAPERIVQFGTGGFLRGFVEFFVDAANARGRGAGSIVAVASSPSGRDAILNAQDGLFTLVTRGLENGAPVERQRVVASLSRALSASDQWNAVLAVARDPNISMIVSNTTEIGIALDADDRPGPGAPKSFPGKLTRFLYERAQAFDYSPGRGLIVLPCELIENNGSRLREIVRALSALWGYGRQFDRWVEEEVRFCDTLVDRIVTGTAPAAELTEAAARLGYRDDLRTICESYRLFAIEGDDEVRAAIPFADEEGVVITPDISAYRLRKVRLLNGAHTLMAPLGLLSGIRTVGEAVGDDRVGRFVRQVMYDEIVPALPVAGGEAFADDVLQRLANPFIKHALLDITLQATMKMRVRVVPTMVDAAAHGRPIPNGLALGFAAYLLYRRGDAEVEMREAGLSPPDDSQAEKVRSHWSGVDSRSSSALATMVQAIGADRSLWRDDLTRLPGFTEQVSEHLARACRDGIAAALDAALTTSTQGT